MYLSTKKVCRAGSGPEGKPIRLQARISMQQESGLGLKTSLKVVIGEGIVQNDGNDLCADVKEFVQDDVEEDSGVDVEEDSVGGYMQPKHI